MPDAPIIALAGASGDLAPLPATALLRPRAVHAGPATLGEAIDRAMRIKPERHAFTVDRGAAPARSPDT